jgi:hypothetical protein
MTVSRRWIQTGRVAATRPASRVQCHPVFAPSRVPRPQHRPRSRSASRRDVWRRQRTLRLRAPRTASAWPATMQEEQPAASSRPALPLCPCAPRAPSRRSTRRRAWEATTRRVSHRRRRRRCSSSSSSSSPGAGSDTRRLQLRRPPAWRVGSGGRRPGRDCDSHRRCSRRRRCSRCRRLNRRRSPARFRGAWDMGLLGPGRMSSVQGLQVTATAEE